MKKYIVFWVERYLYEPNIFQRLLSFLFLPLTLIYCLIVWIKYKMTDTIDYGIDVVSIGNLSVGGSGKTPLTTALALKYENVAIVLRGYGRKTQGLHVVSNGHEILCDVESSGDEAMIYALKVPKAIVIVSEKREEGIKKAKEMGAKLVFLDDGYSKHHIKKLDLLIDVRSKNGFCLPSGPYREKIWSGKKVELLQEEIDFKRAVHIENETEKMALVTAIARPQRLDGFLPKVVSKHYFEDHHFFTKEELEEIMESSKAASLLVTFKDYVKIKDFGINISILDLDLDVEPRVYTLIDNYVKGDM
ncbi:tetraacyldisaccharide 4'-kinase [Sulfurimonas sp. HSL3-2]|uniref:tetraacyldisaccharide 4'-kinase n=1 Tax=Hydrocurvibacter mobilis TaxID=3131936 RepID=UPI0031F9A8DE